MTSFDPGDTSIEIYEHLRIISYLETENQDHPRQKW